MTKVIRDALSGKRQEPKGNFDDHAEWGVCQVGTSATFVRDELEEDNLALFGAPGNVTRLSTIVKILEILIHNFY